VVIDRDLWPDKLFAPAKRTDLMPDGTNPVLDKELRSEIFSQGTLMLRLVIQVSMLLSIPLMAVQLFFRPDWAGYYVAYVVLFNMLVGPVFSSGSITLERERKTLSLLLTTLLQPGPIVFAKLLASLRVSTVLTFLLTEQMLLAYALIEELRSRAWTLIIFLAIIAVTCLMTTMVGLLCSAASRRTAVAMVLTYLVLLLLFAAPVAAGQFLANFTRVSESELTALQITSPFSAAFSVPLPQRSDNVTTTVEASAGSGASGGTNLPGVNLPLWAGYLLVNPLLALVIYGVTYLCFRYRWWRASATV
jgi:ABC-type transport system involved in multi-copper enzyme maturation permease subunit